MERHVADPESLAIAMERESPLPGGQLERFAGYGVMGLPFASGHVLGMRRFPANSVGPAYTSVWHRNQAGEWRIYSDTDPMQGCPRYYGSALTESPKVDIDLEWQGPRRLRLRVAAIDLDWSVELAASPMTRAMNLAGGVLPDALWQNGAVLATMGVIASSVLGAGRLRLQGATPNGQSFIANPRLIWRIPTSRATLAGEDLGRPGPLAEQAKLGDFWIPQSGLFAMGQSFFDPLDPARHSTAVAMPRA